MEDIDRLLFRKDSWNQCSSDEKQAILHESLAILSTYTGVDLHFVDEIKDHVGKYIAFEIKGVVGSITFSLITIQGTLSIVDDRSQPNPTLLANLFLFSQNNLLKNYKNQSFLDILFTNETGKGQWGFIGWFDDVFGEYPAENNKMVSTIMPPVS